VLPTTHRLSRRAAATTLPAGGSTGGVGAVGAGLAARVARTAQGGSITSARTPSTPPMRKEMVAATETRSQSAGQQLMDSKVRAMDTSLGACPALSIP
jgi:hypothetical protein